MIQLIDSEVVGSIDCVYISPTEKINIGKEPTRIEEYEQGINWLKSFLKQFPWLYYAIWHLFCPVLMLVNGPKKIRKYVEAGTKILDVGSGPHRWGSDFINIDAFPFPEVDIVADAATLPFEDNSIDKVYSSLVFHQLDMITKLKCLLEINRILKPNGELIIGDWGKAKTKWMRLFFYLVQLLDGFKTTTDNVNGLMIKYITDAGFKNVEEISYINTSIGTYSYYKAYKN